MQIKIKKYTQQKYTEINNKMYIVTPDLEIFDTQDEAVSYIQDLVDQGMSVDSFLVIHAKPEDILIPEELVSLRRI